MNFKPLVNSLTACVVGDFLPSSSDDVKLLPRGLLIIRFLGVDSMNGFLKDRIDLLQVILLLFPIILMLFY